MDSSKPEIPHPRKTFKRPTIYQKYQTFIRLSGRAKLLSLELIILLPLIHLLLKLWGLKSTKRFLTNVISRWKISRQTEDEQVLVQEITHCTHMLERNLRTHPNCLRKSLAVHCLLHQFGHRSSLQLGLLPDENSTDHHAAHAWVEYNGKNITDSVASPPSTPLRSFNVQFLSDTKE